MLSLGFRAYNSALGMVYTGGVQVLCTASTKALYWLYRSLVPLVQQSCTMIKTTNCFISPIEFLKSNKYK